jgi:murein L,D-transpeptidase YafK
MPFVTESIPLHRYRRDKIDGMLFRQIAPALLGALLTIASAASEIPLAPAAIADKVVVIKNEHKLLLMKDGRVLKTYLVSLGESPVGAKMRRGDHKTPEGDYVLDWHNPRSEYYRSIHISYPNEADRKRARRMGVSPGGDVFVHGLPNDYKPLAHENLGDWTDGCIAVTDAEMDEIWRAVPDGTPIEIRP